MTILREPEGEGCTLWHDHPSFHVCQLIDDDYEVSVVFQEVNDGYMPVRVSGWIAQELYLNHGAEIDQNFRLGNSPKVRGEFSIMEGEHQYLVEYTFKRAEERIIFSKDVLDID